ncbi:MAG: ATPase AAA [Cenarchaeum symbiont of Oopsacas minuta]|nr:ATPase AAA [Cenarchaeum symbiont of Oopsacas minuta]
MVDEPLQMRIGEAKQRDVGKKRARIGPEAMDYLKATPGDIVEIIGERKTSAVVWPADEDEKHMEVIRIDGQLRKNLGVSLNDTVSIVKVTSKIANSITLVPTSDAVTVDKEFTDFVKNRLKGLPLSQGDEISVTILGNSMSFQIAKCSPKTIVKIDHSTILHILEDAVHNDKPHITYEEIGGLSDKIKAMREIVEVPLRHPELFARLGVEAHSGILLYGPPGCGKTLIAKVLASESDAKMYLINGPEIINKYYGETEAKLRDIFKEAKNNSPSIIFIDEMDAIAPKREDVYGDVEKRVVAQLLALMDGLTERGNVIVLGATNRRDSIDPALRRPGRFDREVEITVPDEDGRYEVLQIHTRGMPVAEGVDLRDLAFNLHGYTGADIKSLCRESAIKSIRRYLPQIDLETEKIPYGVLQSMEIKIIDFYEAMREVVPTVMREFYVERPKIWWDDIGGLEDTKTSLTENIILAMRDPNKFHSMGIRPPRGALIYGPPGCGKSLVAKAMAAESGANMILVKGPEILSKWVGESEKAIREIFRKATTSAPCIIILDEIDSLAGIRQTEGGVQDGSSKPMLGQLLTEMEDITSNRVAVIGITNRPDILDPAMLRTGRLDLLLYVAPPDEKSRREIIKIITRNMPLANDVNFAEIAVSTQNYTGADLASLCREAGISAIRSKSKLVNSSDFASALKKTSPSITPEIEKWYLNAQKSISNALPKPLDKPFYR